MLKWFSSIIRDVRINADFPRFEKAHYNKFVVDAYDRFPTAAKEAELARLEERVQAEANTKFNADRDLLHREMDWLEPKLSRSRALVHLFRRNFRAEIDDLYAQKASVHMEQQRLKDETKDQWDHVEALKQEREELHKQRRRYQSEIDSWYAEANRHPWLLGTKNREIPQHSFFRKSHSSLETAKWERQRVFKQLNELKESIGAGYSEIDALKQKLHQNHARLDEIKKQILKTKADRDKWFQLKKAGNTLEGLQNETSCFSQQMTKMLNAMNALTSQHAEFVVATEQSYNLPVLRAEIEARVEQRVAYLRAYELPEQKAQRMAMHREQWMAANPEK